MRRIEKSLETVESMKLEGEKKTQIDVARNEKELILKIRKDVFHFGNLKLLNWFVHLEKRERKKWK